MDQGTTAVVTGSTNGIGEAIARQLAAAGMEVVLVGRDRGRLAAARERITAAVPGARLRDELADLSLLEDVRQLADRLRDTRIDILISNAAVVAELGDHTAEGLQRTLATNHLAPYLLLRTLGENIAAAGGSARLIVVGASPTALRRVPANLEDLGFENPRGLGFPPSFRPFVAYGQTKNMNAMFVYSLAEHLAGSGVTVNGAHPGIIRHTGLGRDSARGLLRVFGWSQWINPLLPGPDAGADTPVWLATAPELAGVTGRFFVRRKDVPTAAHTTEPGRRAELWAKSAHLTGLPARRRRALDG
ncbi:SDR family NAD(P)-dependent oxidoreductase [Nocardia sp. CDC160]|uniref:SDR family NAD(P)-dependent oxidoreductase n=1 Tax=Nocardia sp. CDC160 TaxID=3112166 RepID=UPI002DBA7864|nr:SDR family NAD(P)-dependent oxidoreductase [Nocardia sp. CDC160]MEC3914394.1 SDR family NAD(P)-dependent oxidoreductase [Nocardia sp. CDC160]